MKSFKFENHLEYYSQMEEKVKTEIIDLDNYERPRAVLEAVNTALVTVAQNKVVYKSNNCYLFAASIYPKYPRAFVWLQCQNSCNYKVRCVCSSHLRTTSVRLGQIVCQKRKNGRVCNRL